MEEFLEDINNMLNSGEVPNLFASDEYEQIIAAVRPMAKEHGVLETDRWVDGDIYLLRHRLLLEHFLKS